MQGVTERLDEKKKMTPRIKRLTKINLRNIHMSANLPPPKKNTYFEKVIIYVPNLFDQKNIDILNNS